MLIPSTTQHAGHYNPSLSRRVNANSQQLTTLEDEEYKLIKKGEC